MYLAIATDFIVSYRIAGFFLNKVLLSFWYGHLKFSNGQIIDAESATILRLLPRR